MAAGRVRVSLLSPVSAIAVGTTVSMFTEIEKLLGKLNVSERPSLKTMSKVFS
jgi:hypothetical protein